MFWRSAGNKPRQIPVPNASDLIHLVCQGTESRAEHYGHLRFEVAYGADRIDSLGKVSTGVTEAFGRMHEGIITAPADRLTLLTSRSRCSHPNTG